MIGPNAQALADDLKVSFNQWQSDIAFISDCADGTYERAIRLAIAYGRADTRHLLRCLESARAHGARPDYWLEQLNRWSPEGNYDRPGNLANERHLGLQ